MMPRTVGAAVLVAALTLACKGDKGDPGAQGDPGPQGFIGPPGVGWADAGADIVAVNAGNVGIGTQAPAAKLDVNGDVNVGGVLFQGTRAYAVERSGMLTDVARGRPVTVTGGTLQNGGPTNEDSEGSMWKTTVFPSAMTVDLGRGMPPTIQIAWESQWRGDPRFIPEWSGAGAYVLEYSQDAITWTQIPSAPPAAADLFVHGGTPYLTRYVRLTVKAPHVPGNEVHVALFRVLSFVGGDNSAVDARRLYVPPNVGPTRVWGQGRPGVVRYGTSGTESGLCANAAAGVQFGLSNARVYWEGSAAACPSGTWVCTLAERGTGACDTSRPDTTCDYLDRNGNCGDLPANGALGHVADNGNVGGTEGRFVYENGIASGPGGLGNYSAPVWCCSY